MFLNSERLLLRQCCIQTLRAFLILTAKKCQDNLQRKFRQNLFDKLKHQPDIEHRPAVQLADRC